MATLTRDQSGEQRYQLTGELDFVTVPGLLSESESIFTASTTPISIDLSGVTRANSAGMALLIEWKALAKQAGVEVNFQRIPAEIEHLSAVCKVEELLLNPSVEK